MNKATNNHYNELLADVDNNPYFEDTNWEWGTGDYNWEQYGGMWVARQTLITDEGQFTFYFVRQIWNYQEDSEEPEYQAQLLVVCPDMLTEEKIEGVLDTIGFDDTDWNEMHPTSRICELANYGLRAPLWTSEVSTDENGFIEIFEALDSELVRVRMVFGFYMDAPQNAFGADGWCLCAGDTGF